MADDRPADSPVDALAALQKQVDDLTSTLMARVARRPTGSIEASFLPAAPEDTVFLQGQALNRADFPVLWQWIQDQGLTSTGFTVGNGTTTFGLPDFRGRIPIGVGTLGSNTYALAALTGAASLSVTLATANMPAHTHGVSVSDHGAHNHGISGDGSHSGHQPSGFGAAGGGAALVQYNNVTDGFHNHGAADGNTNVSGHNLTQSSVGSGTPFTVDPRQPSIAVNWLIWT